MIWESRLTHTTKINVQAWMHSVSKESRDLLLAFLVDCIEPLDFLGQVTGCAMESVNEVWFTFDYGTDEQKFLKMVEEIWSNGQWLA